MKINISANQTKSVNAAGKITSAVITCHTTDADPALYTDEAVLAAVLQTVPPKVGAAPLVNAEILEYHGSGVYEIEVNYDLQQSSGGIQRNSSRDLDEKWYMTTSNTVEHILYAQETTAFGNNPPVVSNRINWNGKSGVSSHTAGTNIITGTLRENCLLTISLTKYNTSLRKRILMLTNHTNILAFHGWAAGEVLFLGASTGLPYINDAGDDLIDVTLKFAIRANQNGIFVNGTICSAKGWDTVWPLGNTAVYVSKVYPAADLRLLGVGK